VKKLKQANVAECRAIIRAAYKATGNREPWKIYMDRDHKKAEDDGTRIVACVCRDDGKAVEAANDMFAMAGFSNVARHTASYRGPYAGGWSYLRVNSFIQR